MKFAMKFEGGDELAKALANLPLRVGKRFLREALEQGGEPIRRSMEAKAPRGDPAAPNLADSMVISTARTGDMAAVAIGPSRNVTYGIHQEFGTTRHGAQPFARPAFDSDAPRALPIIAQAAWTELASRGISRSTDAPSVPSGPGSSLL